MKLGLEVEGIFRGIKTLFIDVTELENACKSPALRFADALYVSDPEAIADWDKYLRVLVNSGISLLTWEIHKPADKPVLKTPAPDFKFSIILNCNSMRYPLQHILKLDANDQIKYSKGTRVVIFPRHAAIETFPEDFNDDMEIG